MQQTLKNASISDRWTERYLAATNRLSSPEMLETLALDSEPNVRLAVAQNPCTSENILELLSKDANGTVSLVATKLLASRIKTN